jgi:hypothetical protein
MTCFCGSVSMSKNKPLCSDHRHLIRHLREGARLDRRLVVLIGATLSGDECQSHNYGATTHRDSYLMVTWQGKRTTASRAICELVHGPPPTPKHQAAHSCGNAWCCNGAHLRWATPAENLADKVRHGTADRHRGPVNPRIAALVGKMATAGLSHRELAQQVGVSSRCITRWAAKARDAA